MIVAVCEHYHYTPAQIADCTLYQLRCLLMGVEEMQKEGKREALKRATPQQLQKRNNVIDWYRKQGVKVD